MELKDNKGEIIGYLLNDIFPVYSFEFLNRWYNS